MGAAEKIAGFIVDTGYENLPGDAVEKAKRTALDCFGAALAGVVRAGQPDHHRLRNKARRAWLRHPYSGLVSKFRCKTPPWPMAALPMLWTTTTAV